MARKPEKEMPVGQPLEDFYLDFLRFRLPRHFIIMAQPAEVYDIHQRKTFPDFGVQIPRGEITVVGDITTAPLKKDKDPKERQRGIYNHMNYVLQGVVGILIYQQNVLMAGGLNLTITCIKKLLSGEATTQRAQEALDMAAFAYPHQISPGSNLDWKEITSNLRQNLGMREGENSKKVI